MTEPKEIAIGEIAEIDGVKVRCVEMHVLECCEACHFNKKPCGHINCTPTGRSDGKWTSLQEVVDA